MIGYTDDILENGRRLAETRMTETVRGGRFELSTDPETGHPVRTLITLRYTGKAEVVSRSLDVSAREAASQEVATQTLQVRLPVSAARLPEGDEIVVDASTADADLVNRVYRVTGSPQGGKVTTHRYPVEEQS